MNDKYGFTGKTFSLPDGRMLYQIVADCDFGTIKAGTPGGYIASKENLARHGTCWITENVKVYDNALVTGSALVTGQVRIFERAIVGEHAMIGDHAILKGDSYVSGHAQVSGYSCLAGTASVIDNAIVRCQPLRTRYDRIQPHLTDNAMVMEDAQLLEHGTVRNFGIVRGHAIVKGSARISERGLVSGHAVIRGRTAITGSAWITGHAEIFGTASVTNCAVAFGFSKVGGHSFLTCRCQIGGHEVICNESVSGDELRCKRSQPLSTSPHSLIAHFEHTDATPTVSIGCR